VEEEADAENTRRASPLTKKDVRLRVAEPGRTVQHIDPAI
jgi:hypothetical protein